jgi:hypothetical protein
MTETVLLLHDILRIGGTAKNSNKKLVGNLFASQIFSFLVRFKINKTKLAYEKFPIQNIIRVSEDNFKVTKTLNPQTFILRVREVVNPIKSLSLIYLL